MSHVVFIVWLVIGIIFLFGTPLQEGMEEKQLKKSKRTMVEQLLTNIWAIKTDMLD